MFGKIWELLWGALWTARTLVKTGGVKHHLHDLGDVLCEQMPVVLSVSTVYRQREWIDYTCTLYHGPENGRFGWYSWNSLLFLEVVARWAAGPCVRIANTREGCESTYPWLFCDVGGLCIIWCTEMHVMSFWWNVKCNHKTRTTSILERYFVV